MNGWLRPLNLSERGPLPGGFGLPIQDIRQPQVFLGQTRLRQSYELGRPVAHLDQPPKCCNSPDGTKCFDHSTGECINTWNSTVSTPNAPDCVQNSRGEWLHPDCVGPAPVPQMGRRVRRLPFFSLGAWVKDLPPPPAPTPEPTTAPEPQKLVACVNGPDLYDIYNPDMTLVERAVLNPNSKYPNAQIDFAKFPPCPVPQATGVGGLCDVPSEYLAPKDPSGPRGKPVLVCYDNQGVTLFDYVTGAVIGTHLNAACLSLLSDVTRAEPGDSRCANGGTANIVQPPPPPPGGGTGTTPPSGGTGTTPPSGGQGTTPVSGGGQAMPANGSEPMPAAGGGSFVPVLPPPQSMTTASPPTGAFPGQPFAAMPPPQKPVPIAKAPAPLPPPCPLGPVPLRKWVEGCMG